MKKQSQQRQPLFQKAFRSRTRGAALVEASVVIPVLLVFSGLIVFTYKSYAAKLDMQTQTRTYALYYTSHNCENVDPSIIGGSNSVKMGTGSAVAGLALGQLATAEANNKVSGSVFVNGTTSQLSRDINAWSEVACNIKPIDSPVSAFFSAIGSAALSGASALGGAITSGFNSLF